MGSAWVRWIAYVLLAALVVVTSCQAMSAPTKSATTGSVPAGNVPSVAAADQAARPAALPTGAASRPGARS